MEPTRPRGGVWLQKRGCKAGLHESGPAKDGRVTFARGDRDVIQLHIAANQQTHAVSIQGTQAGLAGLAGEWVMALGPIGGLAGGGMSACGDFDFAGYGLT